jgi:hypothetical protein
MSMPPAQTVPIVKISEDQKTVYEKKRMNLMVHDPWSDPFAKKVGLTNMYIESSIAEVMGLRAELEPGVKLNCPNPLYLYQSDVPATTKDFDPERASFHELLAECLKNPKKDKLNKRSSEERFELLKLFIEGRIIHRSLKIVQWESYIPDIRIVDTIDEAMSWLRQYLLNI